MEDRRRRICARPPSTATDCWVRLCFFQPKARYHPMMDLLLKSPWARAFIPVILMGIVGVSSNSLVAEITLGNTVQWRHVIEKGFFYVLLAATLLAALYQIAVGRYDKEIAKGFTPKQYEAAVRNRVAEEVARRSQKLIRDGNIDQLERETEAFRRMYGEGNQ
jgi:hypothetical protein